METRDLKFSGRNSGHEWNKEFKISEFGSISNTSIWNSQTIYQIWIIWILIKKQALSGWRQCSKWGPHTWKFENFGIPLGWQLYSHPINSFENTTNRSNFVCASVRGFLVRGLRSTGIFSFSVTLPVFYLSPFFDTKSPKTLIIETSLIHRDQT